MFNLSKSFMSWLSIALIPMVAMPESHSPRGISLSSGYFIGVLITHLSKRKRCIVHAIVLTAFFLLLPFVLIEANWTSPLTLLYAGTGLGIATYFIARVFNRKNTTGEDDETCVDTILKKKETDHEANVSIDEREKEYVHLLNSLPVAAYTYDANGQILLYNKAAADLWGREPETGRERWCGSWRLYSADSKPMLPEASSMARAVKEGTKLDEELIVERPDGTRRHVIAYPSPSFNAAGEVTKAVNVLIDVTDIRKAELETLVLTDRLQSKNKELRQVAYMVSHDLRAPIAKILGLASIFDGDAAENKFIVEKITEATVHLDNVVKDINNILSTRNADKGKQEYVHFESKLKLITKVLEQEIKESKALITTDFRGSTGVITAKGHLYSILYNLLSNSIKYRLTETPLRIHLETTEHEKFICLTVKDNGMGIDLLKNEEKIFGLYNRFHGDTFPGKGIGLHLVKRHAESLGGKVEVESKVNEGTEFKIYIPKYERTAG